jgi:hypothetical protein
MRIELLSKTFRRRTVPNTAELDREALRICAVIEHIKLRGNLDDFPADRGECVSLMYAAARQGLIIWDQSRSRYELTHVGEVRLGGLRAAVDGPSKLVGAIGGVFIRSRIKSGLMGAVAGAAACAGLIAWLPSGSFTSPSALEMDDTAVTAPTVAAGEQTALPPQGPFLSRERTEGNVQTGQIPRPSDGDTLVPEDRSTSQKHGYTQQSRKVTTHQKKAGRKARPTDTDKGPLAQRYGSSSTTDRHLRPEGRPSLGFAENDLRNSGRSPWFLPR